MCITPLKEDIGLYDNQTLEMNQQNYAQHFLDSYASFFLFLTPK